MRQQVIVIRIKPAVVHVVGDRADEISPVARGLRPRGVIFLMGLFERVIDRPKIGKTAQPGDKEHGRIGSDGDRQAGRRGGRGRRRGLQLPIDLAAARLRDARGPIRRPGEGRVPTGPSTRKGQIQIDLFVRRETANDIVANPSPLKNDICAVMIEVISMVAVIGRGGSGDVGSSRVQNEGRAVIDHPGNSTGSAAKEIADPNRRRVRRIGRGGNRKKAKQANDGE